MTQGWGKPSDVAAYTGHDVRAVREWLRQGLPYSRLPSGRILIRFEDADAWLGSFRETPAARDDLAQLADDVMMKLAG